MLYKTVLPVHELNKKLELGVKQIQYHSSPEINNELTTLLF